MLQVLGVHIFIPFNRNSSYTTASDSRLKNSWLAFMRTILILNHARQRMLFGFGCVVELHFGVGICGVYRANTSYRRNYPSVYKNGFFVCTIRKPERSSGRKKGPASPFSGFLCGRRVLLWPNLWRLIVMVHAIIASWPVLRLGLISGGQHHLSTVSCPYRLFGILGHLFFRPRLRMTAIMVQQFPGNGTLAASWKNMVV
jgi:hypothetical protein